MDNMFYIVTGLLGFLLSGIWSGNQIGKSHCQNAALESQNMIYFS